MVKYLALAVALVGSLAIAELAEARGRRGCSSCGSCANGVCYTTVSPEKTAQTSNAPPNPVVRTNGTTQPAATATTTQPVRYTNATYTRRGLFGWRR
jgi:hypothetical protein